MRQPVIEERSTVSSIHHTVNRDDDNNQESQREISPEVDLLLMVEMRDNPSPFNVAVDSISERSRVLIFLLVLVPDRRCVEELVD